MKVSVEKIIHKAAEEIETGQAYWSCNAIHYPGPVESHGREHLRYKYEEFLGSWWPWAIDELDEINEKEVKNQRVLMLLLFLETYEEFFGEAS